MSSLVAKKASESPASAVIAPENVPFAEALRVWAKIGLLSFGGPAGQVALMHKELVEKRKWIDEARFLHALNYCMLLPGPEAQQLATYIGWLMHKTKGGLLAGLFFVLPGFVSILALSMLYASFRELPAVAAVFFGLKAAVLAGVVEAVLRIGKRALKSRLMVGVAAAAFLAIFPSLVRLCKFFRLDVVPGRVTDRGLEHARVRVRLRTLESLLHKGDGLAPTL